MLFVTLFHSRPGTALEATRRRLEWVPPDDVKVIAEYWLPTDSPTVVLIAEADDVARIMDTHLAWDAYFEMRTFPALTAEAGMRHAREQMTQAAGAAG